MEAQPVSLAQPSYPSAMAPPQAAPNPSLGRAARFEFTGTGGELLGQMLVGLLLTAITFGLYQPWLMVRMRQWMYSRIKLVTPQGAQCNGAVEPVLYAVDVALPVIDLGQEARCAPGRTIRAELPTGMEVSAESDWRLFEGLALWRWAHALYAVFGAILTALAVLTFSGVMKPRDD